MKPLLLMLAVLGATTLCHGGSKPDTSPLRTQQDIVRDCIVVRNIAFENEGDRNTGISGTITNSCGKEVMVFMVLEFSDRNNNRNDAVLEAISTGRDTAFRGRPDPRDWSIHAIAGRITAVVPRLAPRSASSRTRSKGYL